MVCMLGVAQEWEERVWAGCMPVTLQPEVIAWSQVLAWLRGSGLGCKQIHLSTHWHA